MNRISFFIFLGLLLCIAPSVHAQVSIGSGEEPVPGALLQLKDQTGVITGAANASKGLGMPRVKLTNLIQLYPMFEKDGVNYKIGTTNYVKADEDAKHIGLTVYNLTKDLFAADPIAPGIYVWDGAKWQSLRTVVAGDPATLPTNPTTGIFVGRQNFDIAVTTKTYSLGGLTLSTGPITGTTNRTNQTSVGVSITQGTVTVPITTATQALKADFSQASTNTQTYTFVPTGAVSNVRFRYVAGNGQVIQSLTPTSNYSGSIAANTACSVTATYLNTLNATALGTYTDAVLAGEPLKAPLTAILYVLYNNSSDNTGTDMMLPLKVTVKDSQICGAYTAPGVWKDFQCHNLGVTSAGALLDPLTPVQAIYGNYYKWGNPTVVSTASTSALASASWPAGTDVWLAGSKTWTDFLIGVNNAWNSGTETIPTKVTANDPCPAGYRIPTRTEWISIIKGHTPTYNGVGTYNIVTKRGTWETASNIYNNFAVGSQFGDYLFLPAAGFRDSSTGALSERGLNGIYWSSTENGADAYGMILHSGGAKTYIPDRSYGFPVRCVSEK